MKTGYVYIVECSDQSFYTGVTNNVERRLYEHNTSKQTSYILNRKPIKLVWVSDELDIQDAISLEKQIKGWRREKKIALINESIKRLKKNYYNPRAKKVLNLIKNIEKINFKKNTLGGCIFTLKKDNLCLKIEKT